MGRSKRRGFDDAIEGKGGFGSGAGRLTDWKDKGSIVLFLHADSGITPRLFHLIPYKAKDDSGDTVLWYFPFVCHEDPETHFSNTPAQHCPICRAIERLIDDESINDDASIWKVNVGNKQKNRDVGKLDFCNLKGGDWRGSFKPRAQYVIVVINPEKVDAGLQVAVEAQTMGDALMKVIKGEIDSNGQELGDPRINPYAFKFSYDSDAAPKDKYSAYTYRRAEVTEEISNLMGSPAVDIDSYIDPGDSAMLRSIMNAHFKADIDLDELFDNVLDSNVTHDTASDDEPEVDEPEADEPEDDKTSMMDDLCDTCGGKGTIGKKKAKCPDCDGSGHETSDNEPEMVPCDTCDGNGTIGKKKKNCPDCDGSGLMPDEEGAEEEKEEEPPKETKEDVIKRKKRERERARRAKLKAEKEAKKAAAEAVENDEDDEGIQCGACQRIIAEDAESCKYCGAEFEEDDPED